MTDPVIIEKAIEAIVVLNATITNLRLYPPTSSMISNSIERADTFLQAIFEQEDSVVFAESEKSLIISGLALNEKDQKRPQVIAFIQLMLNFGIKSILFRKGLEREELLAFLKAVGQKPENVIREDGLERLMTGKIRHILLDQKLYVAVDKDQRVVSAGEIRDREKYEDIIKQLMGDSDSVSDLQSLKDAAKDPGWVSDLFKTRMSQITQQKETTPSKELSETVIRMMNIVGQIVDRNSKTEIFRQIVNFLADMDDETLSMVLTQDLPDVPGEDIFDDVVDQLDDERLERLTAKIRQLEEGVHLPEDGRRAYSLEYFLKGGIEKRKRKDPRKSRLLRLRDGLNSILKGEDRAFLDREVMLSLPGTIDQLFSKGKDKHAEGLIDRLGEGLLSENPEVRAEVSTVLAQVNFNFVSGQRTDQMTRLSHKLINWVKFETTVHPNYKHICDQLKNVAQTLIRTHQFAECNQLLEAFHLIHSRKIEKNEAIQAVAGSVLKGAASDDILDLLLQAFETDQKGLRDQVDKTLTLLGAKMAPSTSPTKKERIDSVREEPAGDDFAQHLKRVDQHVEQGDSKSAVKILFDLIVKYAKEKEFSKADMLRERLLEVDPVALTEIIKSGEIIEEEKSGAMDKGHRDLWTNLYDSLSKEESNALYYAMKSAAFGPDQSIIRQGDLNSSIYFVDEGQLKTVFHKEGEAFLIKELKPGDIAGDDSFFSITVCTTSVISLSHARLSFLEKEVLKKWENEFPSLEAKVKDYCLGFEKISDLLEEKGLDRRSYERVKMSVKCSIRPVDDSGVPVEKPMTGTLVDISEGGLAFYIKISKDKAATLLLGPKLNVRCILPAGELQRQIDQNGTVVGAQHHFYDYCINVKFDKLLDKKIIEEIKVSENSDE
ncbi:MAG: cyclic nucleotide-binding domain-containing protein [Pseudomonadota bacterium]